MTDGPNYSAKDLASGIADSARVWITENSAYFDPLQFASEGERLLREKAFAEVGIYLMYASIYDRVVEDKLSDIVFRVTNTEAYYSKLSEDPEDIVYFSHPMVAAHMHDELGDPARRTLDRTLRGVDPSILEFYIYELDLYNICQLYGWESLSLEPTEILDTSSLDTDLSSVSATIMDGYEITHLPMYIHNFGANRQRPIESYTELPFKRLTEGLILRFIAEDETDLVIELALGGVLDGTISDNVLYLVLNWAAKFVQDLGYVPTRHGNDFSLLPGPAREEIDDWEPEFEEFARNYHTVLMSAFLGIVTQNYLNENTVQKPDRDEINELVNLGRCLALSSRSDSEAVREAKSSLDESIDATEHRELYRLLQ